MKQQKLNTVVEMRCKMKLTDIFMICLVLTYNRIQIQKRLWYVQQYIYRLLQFMF